MARTAKSKKVEQSELERMVARCAATWPTATSGVCSSSCLPQSASIPGCDWLLESQVRKSHSYFSMVGWNTCGARQLRRRSARRSWRLNSAPPPRRSTRAPTPTTRPSATSSSAPPAFVLATLAIDSLEWHDAAMRNTLPRHAWLGACASACLGPHLKVDSTNTSYPFLCSACSLH